MRDIVLSPINDQDLPRQMEVGKIYPVFLELGDHALEDIQISDNLELRFNLIMIPPFETFKLPRRQ